MVPGGSVCLLKATKLLDYIELDNKDQMLGKMILKNV